MGYSANLKSALGQSRIDLIRPVSLVVQDC